MPKQPTRKGNIEAADFRDPFPKSGYTKQYEPYIRGYVGDFCRDYPGAAYEEVLSNAVLISVLVEPNFKPALGYDYSTYLRTALDRQLPRLFYKDGQRTEI